MTWNELKEKAKELGYECKGKLYPYISNGILQFNEDGSVFRIDGYSICFSVDRTPDQMYAIMKALQ